MKDEIMESKKKSLPLCPYKLTQFNLINKKPRIKAKIFYNFYPIL